MDSKLNISLSIQSKWEWDFLQHISKNKTLKKPEVIERAIYRYEKYWLPFLANISSNGLEDLCYLPPLDVHWVWHVHMLSPTKYTKDCNFVVGRLLNHTLNSLHKMEDIRSRTEALWKAKYPLEPFDVLKEKCSKWSKPKHFKTKLSYDIASAVKRQAPFYYQVSLPHYKTDKQFLDDAVVRYLKFLKLKQANPKLFIVPTLDIDLMWHTHQVHPLSYVIDCKVILGSILPHDDDVDDRSSDSKLTKSYEETKKLWKSMFEEEYAKPGAMWRGESPVGKLLETSYCREGYNLKTINVLKDVSVSFDSLVKEESRTFKIAIFHEFRDLQLLSKTRRKLLYSENIVMEKEKKVVVSIGQEIMAEICQCNYLKVTIMEPPSFFSCGVKDIVLYQCNLQIPDHIEDGNHLWNMEMHNIKLGILEDIGPVSMKFSCNTINLPGNSMRCFTLSKLRLTESISDSLLGLGVENEWDYGDKDGTFK